MTRFFKTALALMAAGGGLIASGSAFAFPEPYCVRNFTNNIEPITRVKIADINNTSPAATNAPPTNADQDFTAILGNLHPGSTYAMSTEGNSDGNFTNFFRAYIDWNHDGVFNEDASERYELGSITNSTGVDGKTAGANILIPLSSLTGNTRMRVVKKYSTAGAACDGTDAAGTSYGQAEDYTVNVDPIVVPPPAIPTLAKSFSPTNGDVTLPTTLTLSLGQLNAAAAPLTLTANLVDTLPAGMTVAATPSAATTCPSGTVTAVAAASTVTLGTGAQIPPAGCTVTVKVQVATVGVFANSIPANALQTDGGNYGAIASASYTSTSPGIATYSTGFETPTFVVGQLGAQGGWGRSGGAAADLTIATVNPGAGTQHLRSTWAAAGTGTVVAISPTQGVGTTTYAIASAKFAINQNAALNGTEWDFSPQDPAAALITTRVRFLRPTAGVNKIQVLDPNGGGPGVAAFVDTGAFWTAGTYFDVKVISNRAAQTAQICINGASIFTVNGFARNVGNIAITGTKGTGTNGNTLDVDSVVIDNSNIGTCNGLPAPHTVTPSVGTASGTITPSTPQTVADGATTAFTLAPAVGFHIVATTGTCGGTLAGNVFTTNAVTADCTVVANFAADIVTHVVTPSVGTASGTITPSTPQTVNDGATTAFTLAPAVGFHIVATTGTCGGTLAGNVFTTAAVTADCTVIANFAADTVTHIVTPSVGTPSGTITPSTPQTVNDGATTAFTLAPAVGFHIVPTTGTCGGTLAGNVFTTAAVTADCTVIANFAADAVATFPPDENFDEVTAPALPVGFTTASSGVGVAWVTQTTSADTAPNAAFSPDNTNTGDSSLTTPSVPVSFNSVLTFRHHFNLESGFDGGHLEIAVDGGAFQNFTTAGGTFTTGGYNGTLTTFSGCSATPNPLGNGAAWSGSLAAFTTVTAKLPSSTAGHSVAFRWHLGSDCSVAAAAPNGWWVDTVHLDVGGTLNNPAATVSPTSLSFTVAANATATHTLNIANAAGSAPLTYSIEARGTAGPVLHPYVASMAKAKSRAANSEHEQKLLEVNSRVSKFASSAHGHSSSRPAPWSPIDPNGSPVTFQLDDGSYENSISLNNGTTQFPAVWLNRYAATGALTVNSISIDWPDLATASGDVTGLSINLVAYYDADADGDPTNAVRLGTDTMITIAGPDVFENYPVNFSVPGAGDVYIGFVDAFAAGGTSTIVFSAALDASGDPTLGWVSGKTTNEDPDLNNLANNDLTGTISDLSGGALPGVWLVRAAGSNGGGGTPCTGPIVPWLTAAPSSGSVDGGNNTDVTITADPTAGSLAAGSYTGELCVTTNDPAHALISVPVSLTVTPPPFVPCSGGADEVFCDGFEGSGGGTAGTYTDRTTFLTHVAAGFYENAFNDVTASSAPDPALHYTDAVSGIAYTIDTLPTADDLWNGTGIISTNGSGDQLTVTFTGAPVTAVGGNFFASDVDVLPIVGNQVVLTLSDGTTETFTTAGDTDFRGFTTAAPITSITIDAPNPSDPTDGSWATLDNLIVGQGN